MYFETFFRSVAGHDPYPWQVALATAATLPAKIQAPTGAGKTEAVLAAWLWRGLVAADDVRRATPRRLVWCLPMRTLVEQTAAVAERLVTGLGSLRFGPDREAHGTAIAGPGVRVTRLLGGAADGSFDTRPELREIIVGTQDMLLSRALNRGYGMSRYRWPVHFGLLHNDCLWVFDETQLMGPGLSTAAQLEAFRRDPRTPPALPSGSLWMSATLDDSRLRTVDLRPAELPTHSLTDADLAACPALATRICARKRLARANAPGGDVKALAREIATAHVAGTRTLVVVNRVARAQAVRDALVKLRTSADVRLLHSRFRRDDRRTIADAALAPGWPGILVATQVVEAGVDVSCRTLFTDLAPWSSMVQRFGRCSRAGEYTGGADVRWIDPGEEPADALPYTAAELAASRAELATLDDAGIHAVEGRVRPASGPVLPVIRRKDLLDLFDTTPDLTGHDVDVARFIRDADARDVFVVWRNVPEGGPTEDEPEPSEPELCRVDVFALRDLVKKASARAWTWTPLSSEWTPRHGGDADRIAPGATVLLDSAVGGYSAESGWTGSPSDGPVPVVPVPARPPEGSDSSDELSRSADYVALSLHAADVAQEMRLLRDAIGSVQPWDVLERAARWHDLGKAHPTFQATMRRAATDGHEPHGNGPWAKSPGRARHDRRHFRHELASALAWLALDGDPLGAWLVAAHHGKVRMAVRSRPGERWPADGPPAAPGEDPVFALGVAHGETLPPCDLGDGVATREVVLDLRRAMLGDDDGVGTWADLAARLLEAHGPFRLGYWEALVRIADWRGSARRDVRSTAATAPPGVGREARPAPEPRAAGGAA